MNDSDANALPQAISHCVSDDATVFRPDIFRTCCKINRCVEIMTLRPSGRSGESNRNLTASLASTTDRKIAFSRDYCSDHLPQLMEITVRPWRSRDVLRAVQ